MLGQRTSLRSALCSDIFMDISNDRFVLHYVQVSENTRRLVVEEGGFKYDSDSYADDLPYWNMDYDGKLHLTIPYTVRSDVKSLHLSWMDRIHI